jgi:hypothetical protein
MNRRHPYFSLWYALPLASAAIFAIGRVALTAGNNAQRSISAYLIIAAVVPVIIGTVHALSTLSKTSQTAGEEDARVVAESALLVINCVVLASLLILLCSGNAFQPWT